MPHRPRRPQRPRRLRLRQPTRRSNIRPRGIGSGSSTSTACNGKPRPVRGNGTGGGAGRHARYDACAMPTPSHTAQPWDAEAYDRGFRCVADLARDLLDWLDPRPGERILDLGCGAGRLTAAIADRGTHVTGLDADAAMIAAARAQHPAIAFRHADARTFTVDAPDGGPLDAVFSNAVLHWIPEQDAVLASVAAALRPGGRFVAEMGGHGNVRAVLGALREALRAEGIPAEVIGFQWYYPTPAQQAAMLERHGFAVRQLACFDRPTPLEHGAEGLREWYHMFARPFLALVDATRREAVVERAEAAARPLFRNGQWVADYVRLRFVAQKIGVEPAGGAAAER